MEKKKNGFSIYGMGTTTKKQLHKKKVFNFIFFFYL